jgi:hypothetical protein
MCLSRLNKAKLLLAVTEVLLAFYLFLCLFFAFNTDLKS